MLHLIFQSPIDNAVLDRMATGDIAVFLESAVFGILQNGALSDALNTKLSTNRLCVLSEDMATRGILLSELVIGLEAIDYAELVKLTVANPLISSWC
ncbi:MAG: sulfurtransferase TusB [Methyloglobulus sp.]|nr:DsrH/TusB family sulfur metabolism protein [Pseudomonadota bacterium]MSS75599.1 sulfurtransferase TusB [Methyloglobulus sp.]